MPTEQTSDTGVVEQNEQRRERSDSYYSPGQGALHLRRLTFDLSGMPKACPLEGMVSLVIDEKNEEGRRGWRRHIQSVASKRQGYQTVVDAALPPVKLAELLPQLSERGQQ